MLTKAGLVVALAFGLFGPGVFGSLTASAVEMTNEEQILTQRNGSSGTQVLINEVEMNPRGKDASKEWVELYNPTQADINIGNFAITAQNQQFTIVVPSGTVIGAGQFYVVKIEGEMLSNVFGETLKLIDVAGRMTDVTPSILDKSNDSGSWQRIPDGSRTWRFNPATEGEPNDPDTYQKSIERSTRSTSIASVSSTATPQCQGSSLCIEGKVFHMVDTDTLYVRTSEGDYRVDLSLAKVSRSDRNYEGGSAITKGLCLGNDVLVDQDDGQARVEKMSRALAIKGVVYCGSNNLNQELLDSGFVNLDFGQCFVSEFASRDWALRNGCQ